MKYLQQARTTLTNVQVLNLIQGFCKGKCFLTKNDLNTIVAVLTSSSNDSPSQIVKVEEGNSKSESSILDLMNSFISNSYLNQTIIDKQSIKGKWSLFLNLGLINDLFIKKKNNFQRKILKY